MPAVDTKNHQAGKQSGNDCVLVDIPRTANPPKKLTIPLHPMFLGHFAVAFASKQIDNRPSLGTMFLAALWLDLLWPILLLTGTENAAITSDPSAPIPLVFTEYPISHSLLAVMGWSVLFGSVYYFIKKNLRAGLLLGLLVLSHWVLDWLVHIPDLPLTPFGSEKTGLGLWNYPILALAIELLLFAGGVYLYTRKSIPCTKGRKAGFWSLIIFLVIIQVTNVFGPPPPDITPVVVSGLAQWLFVLWAYLTDKGNSRPHIQRGVIRKMEIRKY